MTFGRGHWIMPRMMIKLFWLRIAVGLLLALVPAGQGAANASGRIALVSDLHIDQGTNAALYAAHFDRVVSSVNTTRVDLVLIAGDLTEHGSASEMEDFRNRIRAFQAPVWYVPGNHDIKNGGYDKYDKAR